MFTNTKFIMLSVLLATSNAAAHVAVISSAVPTPVPIVTSMHAGAGSSSAASTVSYITPTAPTGYPSGGFSGSQTGGRPGPPVGGSFPSGVPNGQNGANAGRPNASFGPGGSNPGGASTGGQTGNPHGAPSGSGGPNSSGNPSQNGFPGGSPFGFGRPISRNVPRQNNNQPFPSSGSQSSDITTADNSTFLPYTVAYYTPPFDVRGLSTVKNETQGQELVEFIQDNGGERDGDWWKVSTADFVYHIQSYTTNIGGTVYNLTAVDVSA